MNESVSQDFTILELQYLCSASSIALGNEQTASSPTMLSFSSKKQKDPITSRHIHFLQNSRPIGSAHLVGRAWYD